jgi:1,4-dihydroxy-2-naphthoate octaprenyltransferase
MRLGMLAATLFIAGFYPLTQLGQIDEDRRRGDRTFAGTLGRNVAFLWAAVLLPVASLLNLRCIGGASSTPGRLLVAGFVPLAIAGFAWWRKPRLDATAIADWLAYGAAAVYAIPALLVLTS